MDTLDVVSVYTDEREMQEVNPLKTVAPPLQPQLLNE